MTGAAKKRGGALVPRRRVAPRLVPLAPIIGRDEAIARVAAAFDAGARIVTLTGPPGIGKTRAAVACLERLAPSGTAEGGAWFCDLSQVRTEKELCFAVLALLTERSVAEYVADEDVGARLVELLEEASRTLLVLDNFEQIAFAARSVEGWCRAAPGLAVLVTSRERLAVEGEVVVELAPLACPPDDDDAAIMASDAVRLFVKRARDAGGAVGDEPRVLAAIVRRLEGIPLALELAAARTRLLPLGELAERLEAGQGVLSSITRRAQGRHATLATAIDGSWRLLSRAEQLALARCSVFAGTFSLELAEKVVANPHAVDLLGALRDKSLVHASDDARLGLYVSIRDFAAAQLAALDADEPASTRRRHAETMADMARRFNASRLLQGAAPEPSLHGALRRERENLAAALRFARELPPSEERALWWAELAAAAAHIHALPGEACIVELTGALAALGDSHPTAAATVLLTRQAVYGSLGRAASCLADLGAVGRLSHLPRAYAVLATIYRGIQLRYHGSPREAWPYHEAAAVECEAADLPRLRAMNEACMGRLAGDLRDVDASRAHNERALALSDAVSDSWLGALALANLAQLEQEQQHFARTSELLLTAVRVLRDAGEVQYEAIYSSACGDLFFEWEKHDVARRWYAEATLYFRGFLAHRQTAVAHAAAAALEAHDGDGVRARELLAIARRSAARASNPVVDAVVELHSASVELAAPEDGGPPDLRAWGARLGEADDPRDPLGALAAVSLDARFALRMARRALSRARAALLQGAPVLRVAQDGRWFEVEGAPRSDLGRRGPIRRILLALCERHRAGAGRGLTQSDLAAAGWPGERVLAGAAATRVRVAVSTLRQMGLRSLLLTRDDGYALDPRAQVLVGGG